VFFIFFSRNAAFNGEVQFLSQAVFLGKLVEIEPPAGCFSHSESSAGAEVAAASKTRDAGGVKRNSWRTRQLRVCSGRRQ
jgi:hypothetical protein